MNIALYQVDDLHPHLSQEEWLKHAFNEIWPGSYKGTCTTFNLPRSQKEVIELLEKEGFTLKVEQVFMQKEL